MPVPAWPKTFISALSSNSPIIRGNIRILEPAQQAGMHAVDIGRQQHRRAVEVLRKFTVEPGGEPGRGEKTHTAFAERVVETLYVKAR